MAYASRSLTSAEENYAQIEKEMLAIVFACSKFHQYLYGKEKVQVQSDHKPLQSIMKKPLHRASPRLQRLMLKLQPYDLLVGYVPGKLMYVADTLSRAYIKESVSVSDEDDPCVMIHTMDSVSEPKLNEIREVTEQDEGLQTVQNYIKLGWPNSCQVCPRLSKRLLEC